MFSVTKEIIKDTIFNLFSFIKNNLLNIFWIATILLPYLMYYLGQYLATSRNKIAIGGEAFLPLLIYLILYYIKSYANKIGKGTTIPLPKKRFTTETDEGQVDIEVNRMQELILYVADLENWLEKKGLM